MRAYEGGGLGPDGRPNARPKETRDSSGGGGARGFGGFGLDGARGRRAEFGPPATAADALGAGPATWTSVAVKEGATAAAKRLAVAERGGKTALDLPPKERVALAAALSCAACDAEAWGEHLKAKTESTRARAQHGTPSARAAQRQTETGRDRRRRGARRVRATAKRPDWAETLIEWVRKASDRESFLRHRPIARDETGRAYHVLGGSAGAGMLFVQRPTRRGKPRDAPPRTRTTRLTLRARGSGSGRGEDRGRERPGGSRPRLCPRRRSRRVARRRFAASIAAESRARSRWRASARDAALAASGAFDDWPTRWGMFEVGPTLKALKDWLDDDPRNPKAADERRLKSIAALLMKTARPRRRDDPRRRRRREDEDPPGDRGGGAVETGRGREGGARRRPERELDHRRRVRRPRLRVRGTRVSIGTSRAPRLRWAADPSPKRFLLAAERDRAATALCGVVRHVLERRFQVLDADTPDWLSACLSLLGALPDRLGTGAESVATRRQRGRSPPCWWLVCFPPLEALLRASNAMQPEWLERREAWFTGLARAGGFRPPRAPPQLMTYEEAEAAVEEAAVTAAEAIEWSTTDEAPAAATKIVRRERPPGSSPRSRSAPRPRSSAPEPRAVPRRHPSATHKGVLACQPGSVVALIRKGMRLTRERYVADPAPTRGCR